MPFKSEWEMTLALAFVWLQQSRNEPLSLTGSWTQSFLIEKFYTSNFGSFKAKSLPSLVFGFFLQISLLLALYGAPPICNPRGEHQQVLQDHQRVCTRVPHDQGKGSAAEAEAGQPQREKQDPREDDHRRKFHECRHEVRWTISSSPILEGCAIFFFLIVDKVLSNCSSTMSVKSLSCNTGVPEQGKLRLGAGGGVCIVAVLVLVDTDDYWHLMKWGGGTYQVMPPSIERQMYLSDANSGFSCL